MCPPKSSLGILDRALRNVGLQRETDYDHAYHQAYLDISRAGGEDHKATNRAEDDSTSCHKALVSLNLKRAYKPFPEDDPFYYVTATPSALAAYAPGHILSYRSIELTSFPGIDGNKIKTWQIAYVYTDAEDKAAVSVLVVILPENSKRDKIMAQLPKTDAAISECRTSYSLRKGSAARFASLSESPFIGSFLDQGWICFLPDYMGQQDSFGNGPLGGRCALDAARAVLNFAPLELQPDRKLAFWGYSSGAQAVGWAASQQAAYAPELTSSIVGWAAGGLPVNPLSCAYHMNDNISAGLIIGVVAGLSNAYPALKEWLEASLTPAGKKLYGKASESCFGGFMFAAFLKVVLGSTYFRQDRPLEDALPRKILDQLNLDQPEVPVPSQPLFILGSLHDEVVPTADLDDFVDHWARKGANIEYIRDKLSKHVTLCFTGFPPTLHWLQSRFNGQDTHSKPGEPYMRTVDTTLWLDDDNAEDTTPLDDKQVGDAEPAAEGAPEENPKRSGQSMSQEKSSASGKADIENSVPSFWPTVPEARRRQIRQTLTAFKDKVYFY